MADTLVTPINDSSGFRCFRHRGFRNYSVTGESNYAEMVWDGRHKRRRFDGTGPDWIVVRNRISKLGYCNTELLANALKRLSFRLGFRSIEGLVERAVYRELFPRG